MKIPVRRRFVAGLLGVAALVSVVSIAANPVPDVEPVEDDTPQIEVVVRDDRVVVENVRLTIRCAVDGTCRVKEPNSGQDIGLCPGACEDFALEGGNWHSVLVDGSAVETDWPVVGGIVRAGDYGSDVLTVAPGMVATDLLEVQRGPGPSLEFETVGDAGVTFIRSDDVDRTTATPTNTSGDSEFSWWSPLGIGVALMSLGFGLAVLLGFLLSLRSLLDDRVGSERSSKSEDDAEEDSSKELEAPVAYEMAQERVAVVRDLLDKVREETDPRRSIQAGFAALESGFGRANLMRGNNETAAAYVRRILGSSEGLREPLGDIVALFERARFSDLPVDASMRLKMIERLEEVQRDWERRALELAKQEPAAPVGVPVAVSAFDSSKADDAR